ncbi:MAG: RNA polymerase sigma factor [Planctomycetota bacterium]
MSVEHTPPAEAGTETGEGHRDRILVDAARRGDRAAFAALHGRFAPMVHGILLARVPVGETDDLVQEVFLHAMRKLPTLRAPKAFGPWLATIARNLAVRFHRTRREASGIPQDVTVNHRHPPPDDSESTQSQALEALAAIRSLPETYRETLILRLVEGLTGPQIAAHTGLTPGSVRVNLHRGMNLLRAKLKLNAHPEDH